MKPWLAVKLFILLIAVGLVIAGVTKLKELIEIDQCLDSGGSWNYSKKQCEH